MNDAAAFLTAAAAFISAVAALLVVYRKASEAKAAAERSHAAIIVVDGEIRVLGKRLDGSLSKLLEAEEAKNVAEVKAARSEGVAAGEQAQRDRDMKPIAVKA